jgi:neutral ceramidase
MTWRLTVCLRIVFLTMLCCMALFPQEAVLKAGRAAVKITPPKGMPMQGYYHVRLSEGAHDDLYAKALAVESGGQRFVMVAVDLAAIPKRFVTKAREIVQQKNGLAADRVMVSATHSHTGPELGIRLKGVSDETLKLVKSYHEELPARIAESVDLALKDLQPAKMHAAVGFEDSISFIRRFRMIDGTVGWNPGKLNPKIVKPMGSIDPDVPVVYVESDKSAPLLTYVNFANHLDTVGGMEFSADYPYTLGKVLGNAKGAGMMTMFTIGCAGNINHIDVKTNRPQKGHEEAARIGSILAGSALKAFRHLTEVPVGKIWTKQEVLSLPPTSYPASDVAKAREVVANYGKPGANPFYEQVHAFKVLELEERKGKPIEAEVQVIALGQDIAWVGLPGEIFAEHGKAIKLASPFPYTIIVELANDNVGYVPDRRAYGEGAYEVISTRLAAGGGEAMVESAVRMLLEAHAAAAKTR